MSLSLSRHPVHLGLGATAVSEPEFNGMEWYERYAERHASDGLEGRLVSMYTSMRRGAAGRCIRGAACAFEQHSWPRKAVIVPPAPARASAHGGC